ncbi:MAG: Calx-beta domain-containing protein, partial [Candidatus Poribacteria bacterium]|nr:Calx-beta domain-containing protein [Candidatus Poribacteria bacterium]
MDENFALGAGADSSVYSLAIQSDGKILAGGGFSQFDQLSRNGLVRLTESGGIDPTVNFGTGANGSVLDIMIRPDFKVLIAGGFTLFNGEERDHFAQLHGGIIDGSGLLEFTSPLFEVGETGTNAVVKVVRKGGLAGTVLVNFETRLSSKPSPAVPGLDYEHTTLKLEFPEGEVLQIAEVPIINDTDVEPVEVVDLLLSDFEEGTQGLQTVASLLISSDDSVLSFTSANFSVSEGTEGGLANVKIERLGAIEGEAQVSFLTATNGTATAKLDFQMISNTVHFLDGEISKVVQVPIIDDAIVESIESVSLLLTNALGKVLLGANESLLNILDDDFAPGQFYFESPSFKVRENVGFATITVLRTNGYTGSIVMDFSASDLTAKNGEDYTAITGKLVFGDGEISSGFDIPIINDDTEEGAEALRVRIFDPTGGGAIIPPSFATVIIEDDESGGLVGGIKLDG